MRRATRVHRDSRVVVARSTCLSGLICKHIRPGACAMTACIACIQDPGKGVERTNATVCPPAIPFGDAFPNGEISPFTCWSLNYGSKFPLFSGELALARSREARVSRLIGKFDTTASERKRQVVILALPWEAPGGEGDCLRKSAPKSRSATPLWRWRLSSCDGHWPLEQLSVVLPTVSAVARPGSLSCDALCRFLRSLADRIPGSLLHHWHPRYSNWGAVQFFHSSQ